MYKSEVETKSICLFYVCGCILSSDWKHISWKKNHKSIGTPDFTEIFANGKKQGNYEV